MIEEKNLPALLRAFADLYETHPELVHAVPDLPMHLFGQKVKVYCLDHAGMVAGSTIRAMAKAIGGRWEKNDPKSSEYDAGYYRLTSATTFCGYRIELWVQRETVCERKVVGEERVVEPAVEAKPEREVVKPVYEYECKPLFREADRELTATLEEISA